MPTMTDTALAFYDACESGQGWPGCHPYCTAEAGFVAQSEALAGINTLHLYTDWMKGLLAILPDGRYEMRSLATDVERDIVIAYGVFEGTHTGPGGPVAPTGKSVTADYAYVMKFTGGKICHMTKIWHSYMSLQQLGWV